MAIGKGFRIRLVDTYARDGHPHKLGLDTLSKIKFEPPVVVSACREIFGSSEYKKILVVWDKTKHFYTFIYFLKSLFLKVWGIVTMSKLVITIFINSFFGASSYFICRQNEFHHDFIHDESSSHKSLK